ncbi:MAG TPA: M23 family metallopeptidase [Nitrospiraceae bacterium]|nr:M23 family metallopeptidase [Nitrospiraceae bacterium]
MAPTESPPLDRCEAEGRLRYEPCIAKPPSDREECLRVYDEAVNTCTNPGNPPKGNESQNMYRIPYADGTNVKISRDVNDHNPRGRIDMHGRGMGTHRIVAAADGTIRHIQDGRSKQQHPERWLRNTRTCFNNYVWIEHANHEWSKYSHMQFGTTRSKAGLKEGDKVAQGDYLGDEGNVGCAWPAHLHFEIVKVREDDNNPAVNENDGDLEKYGFEDQRNPRFSDLEGKIFTFKDGENYIAGGLPKCRKDTECPSGNYCNAGADLATNRCMSLKADNETCDVAGGGHQCKSGYCKFGRCYTPNSVGWGGTCYTDDACAEGKCSDIGGLKGVCVCKKDTDCSEGKYCDAGADLNLNTCQPRKADHDTCDLAGGGHQCKSGFCKLSRCYTPNSVAMGGTCYNDDACKEGKCSSIDGTKGTCVCKSDSDCDPGQWCDEGLDTKINTCRAKLDKGETCGKAGSMGNDHKCKSGECSGLVGGYKCK